MSISSSIGANSTINGDGGGVYNTQNGSITLSQSQINNNVCDNGNGGGIYNIGMVEFMSGSSASRNRANNGNGGGIFNALDATVTMNPNTFVGLNEANNGGGIYNVGLFNCTNCNIGSTSNTALNDGGGIYNIGNSTLTANINSFPSELTSNIANNNGGGIFNNGMLEITGYKLEGNNVFSFDMDDDEEGGSIFNDLLGVLTIRDSSITFSNADGGGGGVRNLGDFTAINVTISTNTTMGNGGGIKNSGELTLTNVTIANNMASEGGGIWDDSIITVNIKNSLVVGNTATSTGANCQGPIANPIGSNVSDDTSCPFPVQNFDTANMLGPLTGFGGGNSTSLHSLIPFGSNPAIDSILPQDCTDQETPANMITADQRGSIRPVNFNCDSGAFEFLPLISIRIKKIVAPTSDEDFSFTSSGLSDSGLCSVAFSPLTQDDFILRDNLLFGEFLSCFNLPGGAENVYTITEMIPPGQKLNISCRDVVDGLITNNETGMLTFSSLIGGGIECVFINTLINTLVNVEEATLKQCPLGGIVIQTGPDSNINGMLDPEEVVDEFIVCDEEPGPQGPPGDDGEPGPQGPPGDDGEGFNSLTDINIEPAGPNCANGGFRFDVGLDLNRNGILDPEEITDTSYACNGADGTDGTNGSKCALAGGGSDGGLSELIALLVLPLFIVLGRRLRRRGVG